MTGHILARFTMSEGVVFFSLITFDSEVLLSEWVDGYLNHGEFHSNDRVENQDY
jgi:hypothetical protein